METTATEREISAWADIGKKIGVFGKVPLTVFNWIVSRIPTVNAEVALVHPDGDKIFLTWRDDAYFYGWHLPGSFVFFRKSWYETCQRVIKKEVSPELRLERIKFVTTFNFRTVKQDPRGHANPTLFLAYSDTAGENLLRRFRSEKGKFFGELPTEIMQVKVPEEVLRDETIPNPPCSSHEILFKAAVGHLTNNMEWLAEVRYYQENFC